MPLLQHNFIADMPGPQFLFLFVVALVMAHLVCWQWRQMADPTDGQSPPPVPTSPDPYSIAYLRGGANEATRLAAFSLLQRGILRISEEQPKKFWQSSSSPPTLQRVPGAAVHNLWPAEEAVYEASRFPLTAQMIFGEQGAATRIGRHFQSAQSFLEKENLLTSPELRSSITNCNWWASGALLLLGSYKLIDAVIEGRSNIWFLIILMVATPLTFIPARAPRLTAKGRAYLKQLQNAFHDLRWATPRSQSATHSSADMLPMLMLSAAIFGVGALQGTAFADYNRMFPQAQNANSSGCGSSGCGSSGCGSSGCGGGGGGCGGCGGG